MLGGGGGGGSLARGGLSTQSSRASVASEPSILSATSASGFQRKKIEVHMEVLWSTVSDADSGK